MHPLSGPLSPSTPFPRRKKGKLRWNNYSRRDSTWWRVLNNLSASEYYMQTAVNFNIKVSIPLKIFNGFLQKTAYTQRPHTKRPRLPAKHQFYEFLSSFPSQNGKMRNLINTPKNLCSAESHLWTVWKFALWIIIKQYCMNWRQRNYTENSWPKYSNMTALNPGKSLSRQKGQGPKRGWSIPSTSFRTGGTVTTKQHGFQLHQLHFSRNTTLVMYCNCEYAQTYSAIPAADFTISNTEFTADGCFKTS